MDYDYLITKKKLEEGDELDDFITKTTEFTTPAFGDQNIKGLKKGMLIPPFISPILTHSLVLIFYRFLSFFFL